MELEETQENETTQENEIIQKLLREFSSSRASIYKMIEEIEEISANVKNLFPEKFDARYRLIFQERVRAVTELFKALLDMRKEITKNIKDEIELRRKVAGENKFENIEELLNISSIVDKIDKMNDDKNLKIKKVKQVSNIPYIDELDDNMDELVNDRTLIKLKKMGD